MTARATQYQFQPDGCFEGEPMDGAHLHNPIAPVVEWTGGTWWAIRRGSGWTPSRCWCESSREWEWEPLPSERDEAFYARTRYPLAVALDIAERLATEGESADPYGCGTVDGQAMSGKEELNAITRNTYCVNEKIPPTYARKWKLYVLHLDGTSETFFGDDSDGGYADVYRRALASAERKQVSP